VASKRKPPKLAVCGNCGHSYTRGRKDRVFGEYYCQMYCELTRQRVTEGQAACIYYERRAW